MLILLNMYITRNICRIDNSYYIFDEDDRIWRLSENTHNYKTTAKVLDENFNFNSIKRIITFVNSVNCIDIENGIFRKIQREDYLKSKNKNLKIVNDSTKDIVKLMSKIMTKKDIEKIIVDFEEILFKKINKLMCFSYKSAPICKFISDFMDEYCTHMEILSDGYGNKSLNIMYKSKYKNIFIIVKINEAKDLIPITKYFNEKKDVNFLILFDKIIIKAKETQNITIYNGKKLSDKGRIDGINNSNFIGSLFIKYIINNFYKEDN
jgi:hypothetical protein